MAAPPALTQVTPVQEHPAYKLRVHMAPDPGPEDNACDDKLGTNQMNLQDVNLETTIGAEHTRRILG